MAGRPTNEPSNYFAFGKQTAKDSEASTFTFLRHLDGTALEIDETNQDEREGGDGQEVGLRYKTAIAMDGQAVFNDRAEAAARIFAWGLGADTAAAPAGLGTVASGVANEHLAQPTSLIPYLTLEQFWGDQVERLPNAQIDSIDVEFEAGRPFKITPHFIGGGTPYSPAATQVVTRETGPPFMYPNASVTLDGGNFTHITKGKVTVKRGLDDQIRTLGLNREDVVAQTFDVTADLTVKFESSASSLYDKTHYGAVGGSIVPVDLATTSLKIYQTAGAGTNLRYQEIGLNALHLTGARVNKLDPGGKTMFADLAFEGFRFAGTSQVYVKTSVASIAAL